VASVVAFVSGCGGGSGQVQLAHLVSDQDAYVGRNITTSGRVEEQTNINGSHYYVLADSAQNLVILVPAQRARRFADRHVSVSGHFGFNPHVGRLIDIASITASD